MDDYQRRGRACKIDQIHYSLSLKAIHLALLPSSPCKSHPSQPKGASFAKQVERRQRRSANGFGSVTVSALNQEIRMTQNIYF